MIRCGKTKGVRYLEDSVRFRLEQPLDTNAFDFILHCGLNY